MAKACRQVVIIVVKPRVPVGSGGINTGNRIKLGEQGSGLVEVERPVFCRAAHGVCSVEGGC